MERIAESTGGLLRGEFSGLSIRRTLLDHLVSRATVDRADRGADKGSRTVSAFTTCTILQSHDADSGVQIFRRSVAEARADGVVALEPREGLVERQQVDVGSLVRL